MEKKIATDNKSLEEIWEGFKNINQRKVPKEIILEAKQKIWRKFSDKIERDSKSNQKMFYKTLKTLRKGRNRRTDCIRSKKEQIIKEGGEIMHRWRGYFEK
ncbi:hypothetical protein ILUMI_24710 [Ignelater luminosus]|uniref:Uncharacterized protein n=1 Tax=Ignelater luminosus TaxID=2038154 RepID=A0A8K0G0M2_IGNLU|nr:hypothetical protein ILUMI_24710 [Ignelater luminosus]